MADNSNLRAQLAEAATSGMTWPRERVAAHAAVKAIWPLVVAFGDARYQEGRKDAAEAIEARRVKGSSPNAAGTFDLGWTRGLGFAAQLARGGRADG